MPAHLKTNIRLLCPEGRILPTNADLNEDTVETIDAGLNNFCNVLAALGKYII
jgi:hypothetical protein